MKNFNGFLAFHSQASRCCKDKLTWPSLLFSKHLSVVVTNLFEKSLSLFAAYNYPHVNSN